MIEGYNLHATKLQKYKLHTSIRAIIAPEKY